MKRITILCVLLCCFGIAYSQTKHQVEFNSGLVYLDTDISPEQYPYFNTKGFGIGLSYGYLLKKKWTIGASVNHANRDLSIFQGDSSYDEQTRIFSTQGFVSYNLLPAGSKSELPIKATVGIAAINRNLLNTANNRFKEKHHSLMYGLEISYYYQMSPQWKLGLGSSAELLNKKDYVDIPVLYQNKLKVTYSF